MLFLTLFRAVCARARGKIYFQEITEERTLLQFHFTEWHSHTCPFGTAVLEFRRRVRAVVGSTIKNESGPMIVHCKWVQRIKTFRCEIVVEERATRVANAIINLLFVCGAKRRRRTVGGVLSDRRKYGAGRGGGRVRCVWLLEETQAEQKGAYRKYGTIYIYLSNTRKLISRSTEEI